MEITRMNCLIDETQLVMTDCNRVEIDYQGLSEKSTSAGLATRSYLKFV